MYLSAKEVRELYKITSQTLYNWRKNNHIKFTKTPSGKYLYTPLEDVNTNKKHVIYGRVSNTKQKEDLSRQMSILRSYVTSSGHEVDHEFSDVASGMNENRKGLNNLIELCVSGEVEKVYVTHKDRLTRFGFGYMMTFLSKFGVEIVVLNATKEEDFQQELTEDLISIINHFSMKVDSNRRKKLKDFEKNY